MKNDGEIEKIIEDAFKAGVDAYRDSKLFIDIVTMDSKAKKYANKQMKFLNIPDTKERREQLITEQINWLMINTSLDVEKIVDFKEQFK